MYMGSAQRDFNRETFTGRSRRFGKRSSGRLGIGEREPNRTEPNKRSGFPPRPRSLEWPGPPPRPGWEAEAARRPEALAEASVRAPGSASPHSRATLRQGGRARLREASTRWRTARARPRRPAFARAHIGGARVPWEGSLRFIPARTHGVLDERKRDAFALNLGPLLRELRRAGACSSAARVDQRSGGRRRATWAVHHLRTGGRWQSVLVTSGPATPPSWPRTRPR